ncbi:acyclic terpene utilization AtuA family protein [Sphingorhabdus sp. SMR4y]|uniref:acyclic terpene utilization AtuA family protein n=1 Tax=Sphingorhabdus sp. SMR4y TaxID=2584094 RepID=UPI000B5C2BAB|nr:acyclic terpene utilization AtuA family protein [Sphingorhabdus sp. SMR4y]ASK89192.1 terpene utilization protein AtuA [Sphingorhabdus sp. SMR4y]
MPDRTIRIGGASGYWGESAMATPQLLGAGVDYLVYDYLAEITMSIMARAHAKDPAAGFAGDFISAVLKPHAKAIAAKGVKVIANAGGVNPASCGEAARALIREQGLDLKVAVITGDNLLGERDAIAAAAPKEMFTGAAFPDKDKIASINAYLGAFPIARALAEGADIVITGRCVDSAVTLGACIYEFGWSASDHDLLASGSLAGHLLECGPQATGGNYTDWEEAGDISNIGYPIGSVAADGSFTISKPEGTGGCVTIGTVSEQMLYEIGDPQAYMLPDVVCDFSQVEIVQTGPDRVRVSQAIGYPAPDHYKTCLTYGEGFRGGTYVSFYGFDAARKAQKFCDNVLVRANAILRGHNLGEYSETSVEIIGAESQFGDYASDHEPREVVAKIAAKHQEAAAIGILLRELTGLGLATPPGLGSFSGARAKPSPVVRLFSYLTPKDAVAVTIDVDGETTAFQDAEGQAFDPAAITRPEPPQTPREPERTVTVPLVRLAWARSGDKGDKANIGVIARDPAYLPYIWAALTPESVAKRFGHFIEGGADAAQIDRYYLPGSHAINFLIDAVLGGGGVASIRNDAQGKGYGQILLAHPVVIPAELAEKLN